MASHHWASLTAFRGASRRRSPHRLVSSPVSADLFLSLCSPQVGGSSAQQRSRAGCRPHTWTPRMLPETIWIWALLGPEKVSADAQTNMTLLDPQKDTVVTFAVERSAWNRARVYTSIKDCTRRQSTHTHSPTVHQSHIRSLEDHSSCVVKWDQTTAKGFTRFWHHRKFL